MVWFTSLHYLLGVLQQLLVLFQGLPKIEAVVPPSPVATPPMTLPASPKETAPSSLIGSNSQSLGRAIGIPNGDSLGVRLQSHFRELEDMARDTAIQNARAETDLMRKICAMQRSFFC